METPSRHSFNLDGTTRVFPVPSPIKGDNYCRLEVDGDIINDRALYDIVNNSIVFITAPIGLLLDILVVQSEEAIGQLAITTNIDIVASNIENINTVGDSIENLNTVENNITSVNTVASNIAAVNNVSTNMSSVVGAVIQATNAANSATAAATSATNSANSATSSANSASASATSATSSANSATSASTSASTATTQAGIATTQATNASNSATSAAASASTATTQAVIATTKADEASSSAIAAASSSATTINAIEPVLSAQAQTNALLGLGIGSSVVDDNGDLIMSYNEATVTDLSFNANGELIITY
jgi:hypothetical protein